MRLAHALGTTPGFWLRMQMHRELWVAQQKGIPPVRSLIETLA